MGYPPLRVAVNLSLQTFKKNKVTDMIHRILRETGLNANQLEIEMTESWMMRCPEQTVRSLIQLRDMGICLALDDFGGGYSSLNYLKQLPVDVLKIGQRFIRNILTDRHDQIIVRTIIELAHHFEMKVVAEGVETPEQLKLLSETNCDYVQGYLINRPLPASDVEKYFISGTQHFHSLT
jgi:EAL domain-containing protein (putative c-di-GMP-specific phosphodiesterase class I)